MTLKDYIINDIGQIKVFSEYLNISENDIMFSINYKSKLKSPFHKDNDPSLSFRYYGSKLICRDFGSVEHSGDIFQIVGKIIHEDCNDAKGFVNICKNIIDSIENNAGKRNRRNIINDANSISDPTTITFVDRNFNNKDFKYFYQYFIKKEDVINNYVPVNTYFINGYRSSYYHASGDPCYAYVNNPNSVKLYFPFRQRNEKRFITNNKFPVELIHTLSVKDYTVLIKAYKDKILMDMVCKILEIDNIQFLPVASESSRIANDIIRVLKSHTNKRLFTMFDLDKCGVESSFYYKHKHSIDNIFLGDNYNTKDPTDLVKHIKLQSFIKRFFKIYKTF